ncbi:hypothetical protein M3E13_19480 [Oceanobacillus kimchii]|uniref:hypothetical protein n=1 Tax=Oceanobacillus kimchii TaxID=746691 RepID=UPI0021A38861|nr:hypothetical protein [Oceanobacillus kimchii]MCT1575713.1 hypothetical protein [Oceanobacillus kimchii]MCT2138082.1 hypothetical protein [Oceanobacillus kimchii]
MEFPVIHTNFWDGVIAVPVIVILTQCFEDIQIAYSLKIALIGGLITTLGDAISTYAASIAIEESIQDNISQSQDKKQLEDRFKKIEKQLEVIQKEMNT